MTASPVTLEREGGIALCTLSNPPRHTLTAEGVAALGEVLDELEGDRDLRALVLTGGGEGVVVAHYEVGELAAASEARGRAEAPGADAPAPSADEVRLHPFHRVLLRLERLRAPTVAAVNGHAAGGGCELALACDFRLLCDGDFRFGLPETSVGIIPGAGGTQRMARLLGVARTLDLVLHARLLTPGEALAIGLAHRVLAAHGFREAALDFARGLAARAPIALAEAKRAIREGAELPLEEGLCAEQRAFERAMASKDAAGAMRAFLEGRSWDWQGE